MSSSQALYRQVHTKLHSLHPTLHLKHLTVWVWVVVGLIQGQSVHLSEIANPALLDLVPAAVRHVHVPGFVIIEATKQRETSLRVD